MKIYGETTLKYHDAKKYDRIYLAFKLNPGKSRKNIIFESPLITFSMINDFGGRLSSSLKPNHHDQVTLVQIPDTHGIVSKIIPFTIKWSSSKEIFFFAVWWLVFLLFVCLIDVRIVVVVAVAVAEKNVETVHLTWRMDSNTPTTALIWYRKPFTLAKRHRSSCCCSCCCCCCSSCCCCYDRRD